MNIFTLLTVVFIVLKLCGVITWGWLIVFSPFIAYLVIYIIVYLVCAIIVKDMAGKMDDWIKK